LVLYAPMNKHINTNKILAVFTFPESLQKCTKRPGGAPNGLKGIKPKPWYRREMYPISGCIGPPMLQERKFAGTIIRPQKSQYSWVQWHLFSLKVVSTKYTVTTLARPLRMLLKTAGMCTCSCYMLQKKATHVDDKSRNRQGHYHHLTANCMEKQLARSRPWCSKS